MYQSHLAAGVVIGGDDRDVAPAERNRSDTGPPVRRRGGSSRCSTHSWTMPTRAFPNDGAARYPSPGPPRSDRRRVPGRPGFRPENPTAAAPGHRLRTRRPRWSPQRRLAQVVALLAERMRPTGLRSPRSRVTCRSSASSVTPTRSRTSRVEVVPGVVPVPGQRTAPVAVAAHAHMPAGIERLIAERARRRPAEMTRWERAANPSRFRGQGTPARRRALLGVVEDHRCRTRCR